MAPVVSLSSYTDIIGVNPLATISALSERSISLIAKRSGFTIDQTENGPLDTSSEPQMSRNGQGPQESIEEKPQSIGCQFTETLSGYISVDSGLGNFTLLRV